MMKFILCVFVACLLLSSVLGQGITNCVKDHPDTLDCEKCADGISGFSPGFYLDFSGAPDAPVTCQPCVDNALICEQTTGLVIECDQYYSVSDDRTTCIPCDEGCVDCTSDGATPIPTITCHHADIGYFLNNGRAFPCDGSETFSAGCTACGDPAVDQGVPEVGGFINCEACDVGFFLSDDQICVPCSDGCDSCESNVVNPVTADTVCTACGTKYVPDGDGCIWYCGTDCDVCPDQGVCSDCSDFYYLDPDHDLCAPITDICTGTNGVECVEHDATDCQLCSPGFYHNDPEDTDCCTACPNSGCEVCIYDALDLDVVVCSSCKATHELQGPDCVWITPDSCVDFNATSNVCSACDTGFYLVNNVCEPCDSDCVDPCDGTTGACSCPAGFFSDTSGCTPCSGAGTATCSQNDVPLSCDPGYFLNTDNTPTTCDSCAVAKNEFCATCELNDVTVECATCSPGYYGVDCVPCGAHVAECAFTTGEATTCDPGFFIEIAGDINCTTCNCERPDSVNSLIVSCTGVLANCTYECIPGFQDCDNTPYSCETDFSLSTSCGSCSNDCTASDGTNNIVDTRCDGNVAEGFSCSINTCAAGFASCDATFSTGCETETVADVDNCGSCFFSCADDLGPVNVDTTVGLTCNAGDCEFTTCVTNFGDCTAGAGCETNLLTSSAHCGACDNACSTDDFANVAGVVCDTGVCDYTECLDGFLDCDAATPGCETQINTAANCGYSCDAAPCPTAALFSVSDMACVNGYCEISETGCDIGFEDCDGIVSNGCETDFNNDPRYCSATGICGVFTGCAFDNDHVYEYSCTAGACAIVQCEDGWFDCDSDPATGCESFILDTDTCGSCDFSCGSLANIDLDGTLYCNPSVQARDGTCVYECLQNEFATWYEDCDGAQANGCEVWFAFAETCGGCPDVGGTFDCTSRERVAQTTCVPVDPDNFVDATSFSCLILECQGDQAPFTPGEQIYGDCNNDPDDGCETLLEYNSVTMTRECTACPGTTLDCNLDGTYAGLGCEVDSDTDVNFCGDCDTDCSTLYANVANMACVGGFCTYDSDPTGGDDCVTGYRDCDNDATILGCETNIFDDETNCGDCGTECGSALRAGDTACVQGSCSIITCDSAVVLGETIYYADCDGLYNNGCESETGGLGGRCQTCPADFADCVINAMGTPEWDGGCESSLLAPTSCGSCNNDCTAIDAIEVSTMGCTDGACTILSCEPGYDSCGGPEADGCTIELATDVNHCGACNTPCSAEVNTNAATVDSFHCTNSTCSILTCVPGRADCDGDISNGCETDLSTVGNCGACSNDCVGANVDAASTTCDPVGATFECNIACSGTFADCLPNDPADPDSINSCETQTADSAINCGNCNSEVDGINCLTLDNVEDTTTCSAGICQLVCTDPFDDCNTNPLDGCEINTDTNINHCGSCSNVCNLPNVETHTCNGGTCGVDTCSTFFADCGPSPGCEIDTRTDVNNCGACGVICADLLDVAIGVCADSECSLTAAECEAGKQHCTEDYLDGCETDLRDPAFCGSCNQDCTAGQNVVSATCSATFDCVLTCAPDFDDCNQDPTDGCEFDISTSPCISCPARNLRDCDTAIPGCETDITAVKTCGSCSNDCTALADINVAGVTCSATGDCVLDATEPCTAGFADCNGDPTDGCEVELAVSVDNCGACHNGDDVISDCAPNGANVDVAQTTCTAGACNVVCNDGFANCNNDIDTGCNTNLNTNVNNCGSCGTVCAELVNTESTSCTTGVCTIDTCSVGFRSCDNEDSTGCETPITTITNCGSCGNDCSTLDNVDTVSCSVTSSCIIDTCATNFGNCDGRAANGCETDLLDIETCGSCGNNCTDLPNVMSSSCNSTTLACEIDTCMDGWSDCDDDSTNGCETDITLPKSCGFCTNDCTALNNTIDVSCISGACVIDNCTSTHFDCDGDVDNGCEILESLTACGSCDVNCTGLTNVDSVECLTVRTEKTCVVTCADGFLNLDGNYTTGCETPDVPVPGPSPSGPTGDVTLPPGSSTPTPSEEVPIGAVRTSIAFTVLALVLIALF